MEWGLSNVKKTIGNWDHENQKNYLKSCYL